METRACRSCHKCLEVELLPQRAICPSQMSYSRRAMLRIRRLVHLAPRRVHAHSLHRRRQTHQHLQPQVHRRSRIDRACTAGLHIPQTHRHYLAPREKRDLVVLFPLPPGRHPHHQPQRLSNPHLLMHARGLPRLHNHRCQLHGQCDNQKQRQAAQCRTRWNLTVHQSHYIRSSPLPFPRSRGRPGTPTPHWHRIIHVPIVC